MSSKNRTEKVQVIILAEGEILLLKLSEERGGFWQNITGHVDPGEDFVIAAERELFEEVGIKSKVVELPFTYEFRNRFGKDAFEKVFLCKLNQKITPQLSEEHQEFKWMKINSISSDCYKYVSNFEPVDWLKNE